MFLHPSTSRCCTSFLTPACRNVTATKACKTAAVRTSQDIVYQILKRRNATPLRKWAPAPLDLSDSYVSCTATRHASLHILFKCPTPANIFKTATKPSRFAHFWARCRILCACHTRAHPNFKKCSETTVFDTFDFQMCFAPQRRALFQHLNFQKCSGAEVFCTFLSRNVLRAITACIFSSSELPKVLREWCVFWLWHYYFQACFAPQRRAVFEHLNFSDAEVSFTFWLPHVLRATTALLFDPPGPQSIRKTQCFVTLLPFRALVFSFFWLFLFSNLLSSSFLFSNSSHLFFSIYPYCRKLDFETSFSYCFTNIIVAYFSIRQARWWPHLTCAEFLWGSGGSTNNHCILPK